MLVFVLHDTEFSGRLIMGWGKSSSQDWPRMSRPGASLKAWPDAGLCPWPGLLRFGQCPPYPLLPLTGPGHTCPPCCTTPGWDSPRHPLGSSSPRRLHPTGRALPKPVCAQLPACTTRDGPTAAGLSWAPSCGWMSGPKARPWWIGPRAVPEAALQPP